LLIWRFFLFGKRPKYVSLSGFFKGKHHVGKEPSLWLLMASAVILWIFPNLLLTLPTYQIRLILGRDPL
jgi:hypothetical protein